jgi:hypothetical protein
MDDQGRPRDLSPADRNSAPADEGGSAPQATARRGPRRRRLSDKLLVAFHQACDHGELEVASELLRILETVIARPAPHVMRDRRQVVESLVAAHHRLWELRHPELRHAAD